MIFKTKKVLQIKKLLLILVIFGLIGLLIANPERYIAETKDGIKVWAATVLPSMLPFFFLTNLLTLTGSVTPLTKRVSPLAKFLYGADGIAVYIQTMSFLSGYPVGAKIIADLYKDKAISSAQAEKYSTFTSTSGPLFIVGAVAVGMYNNPTYGIILLSAHILSAVFVGIIFKKLPDNGLIGGHIAHQSYDSLLYEAIHAAIVSVLISGGFIAVFFTAAKIADDIKLLHPAEMFFSLFSDRDTANALATGIVECTKGAMALSAVSKGKMSAALCCGLITFGGLSVWIQSIAYLKQAGVKIRTFASAKLIQSVIAFLISYILLTFL